MHCSASAFIYIYIYIYAYCKLYGLLGFGLCIYNVFSIDRLSALYMQCTKVYMHRLSNPYNLQYIYKYIYIYSLYIYLCALHVQRTQSIYREHILSILCIYTFVHCMLASRYALSFNGRVLLCVSNVFLMCF